ncbi:hypothetical protein RB195_000037 [Necator americanus]|uniref:Uncharacterized protein n=1 Tax=Necator americanus TaxID=51031 RepID=A0ABR1D7P4_NECAM
MKTRFISIVQHYFHSVNSKEKYEHETRVVSSSYFSSFSSVITRTKHSQFSTVLIGFKKSDILNVKHISYLC